MDDWTHTVPLEPAPPAARARDPLAAALGNASLFGIGYLMLGRRKLAAVAAISSIVLLSFHASIAEPWSEVLVLVWWAALVAHGWFAAGGRTGRVALRGQRLVALGVTVPLLLAVGLLRYDASRITRSTTEARDRGDCAGVLAAQDRVWFGHRVADAPLTARGEELAEACHRLRTAKTLLSTGLTGDTKALKEGFATLSAVLTRPGQNKTVEVVLNDFLNDLPTRKPCHTVTVTDWLRDREPTHNLLDRSAAAAERIAPAALAGCGDALMASDDWKSAREHYKQLISQYPDDERTDKARKGVREATMAIELDNVRELLDVSSNDTQPEYCSAPAKYSGAAPYGEGTNLALFYGNSQYAGQLPGEWRTADPTKAEIVVCLGDVEEGVAVQTCPYENELALGGASDVTFHKVAIPVKVYELRTGELVADRKVQISGESCPAVLHYTTYTPGLGIPPSDVNVEPSESDVRAAFKPLIVR